MPHFKSKLLVLALCVAGFDATQACANGVDPYDYSIDVFYDGGSVTGTITTDGTFSSGLSDSIITDWNITLNDGLGHTTSLDPSNSNLGPSGSDLTATPTQLDFNFSAGSPDSIDFTSKEFPATSFFDIFVDINLGTGMEWGVNNGGTILDPNFTGNEAIAETPLPASLPLFAAGLIILTLLGGARIWKNAFIAA